MLIGFALVSSSSIWTPISIAQETNKASDDKTALLPEIEAIVAGGWGKISDRGTAGINDANLITAAAACKRSRRIVSAEFLEGAEKILPDPPFRRGNIVFYRTEKGLQRLDTALRKIVLISKIEKQVVGGKRIVWRLSTTKGSVRLGVGKIRRGGRSLPVLIEQNSVFLRCPQPKTKSKPASE